MVRFPDSELCFQISDYVFGFGIVLFASTRIKFTLCMAGFDRYYEKDVKFLFFSRVAAQGQIPADVQAAFG